MKLFKINKSSTNLQRFFAVVQAEIKKVTKKCEDPLISIGLSVRLFKWETWDLVQFSLQIQAECGIIILAK